MNLNSYIEKKTGKQLETTKSFIVERKVGT